MAGGKLISTGVEFPDATTQTTSGLPLTGGALTGAVTTTSTFDGVDIATRDGVLTSTTTTANNALPKAGGTMTGTLTGTVLNDSDGNVRSGRKNLIINGGFDVWQRGTSFSGVSNGAYTADRWTILDSVGNNITTVTPKTTTDKYTYVEKTSGTGSGGLHQFVEINHLIPSGTNLVISFDGTHLSGTNSYRVAIQYRPNNSWSGVSSEIGTLTFVTSEGLNSLTVTTTEDMVQGDMAVKILPNTTGNYKYGIAEVQLELGSVATDFEHRSYGEELALCQRYYWQMQDDGTTAQFIMTGLNSSFTQVSFYPPVPFRVKPTIGVTDTTPYWESYPWNSIGTTMTISSVSNGHFNKYGGEFAISATFSPTPTRGTNYTVDAEVFTFDAEL